MFKSDLILVDEIASKLKSVRLRVSTDSVVLAKKIIASAHEKHVTSGRNPATVAAAAFYIACRMEGDRINQKDVALAVGLSEVTVRSYFKVLMGRLRLVFPSVDRESVG